MDDLGFKVLTPENWLSRDPACRHFVRISPEGVLSSPTGEGWAAAILAPTLAPTVPLETRRLFEVARGTLCYGVLFYPLFALGSEQLYRVLESALHARCTAAGVPTTAGTFKKQQIWAIAHGIIPSDRADQWDAVRYLRNGASHLRDQSIYDPTMALSNLDTAVELINSLFEPPAGEPASFA